MRGLLRTAAVSVLVAGCSSLGGVPRDSTDLPTCTTSSECLAHDGERIQVVGVYVVWDPRGVAPEHSRSRLVKVRLDGGKNGPYLERGRKRPLAEIAAFRGKRVRVIGRYLRDMRTHTDDTIAQLLGQCIVDIEAITLAE